MIQRRASTLALTLCLGAACNKTNPAHPPARPRPVVVAEDVPRAAAVVDEGPLVPPHDAIFVLRGAALRKVLNIIAPGAPTRLALGQVAPSYSPGIGEHGVDVDPDAPFAAVAMPHTEGDRGRLQILIAWPLRSGMQIAQDAQAGHGYREVLQGIYESTAAPEPGDAGALAARNPCWVAHKQPVGWMLVCGPPDVLRVAANYLVRAASHAPDGDPVLDLTFHPEAARPVLASQLASLEAQDPRRTGVDAGASINAALRAQYDEVHRTALTYKEVADDLSTFHAALTLDDTNYHVRAQAEFSNATGPNTRALLASTIGHHTASELLVRLPSTASSYMVTSFDGGALGPLLGGSDDEDDPRVAQALGPEFLRFQHALHDLTSMRRAGERAIGFMTEEGGTKIEIMRMENPTAALTAVRTAAAAVPHTPRASGMNPGDQFAIVPTPAGLPAGTLRLRLNPDPARLPPNAPPEMRRMYSRTTLLVPENNTLTLIDSQDPVARWTAMQHGQHLTTTMADDGAGLAHLSPMALLMLVGVPATDEIQHQANGDPIHGTLSARRVGDAGAHYDLQIDAPIVSVNQARDVVAQIQAQQAQAMEQQRAQMQQAQQAARRAPQRGGPGMMMPTPSSPDQLPEPDFQLRPPSQ